MASAALLSSAKWTKQSERWLRGSGDDEVQIVLDFAETLVKERPMIEWVLFELRNREVPLWRRVLLMFNSFTRGLLSIVFGRFRATSEWAAKVAYMSFRGVSEKSLERMINHKKLNLNPEAMSVLSKIKLDRSDDLSQSIGVSIYSQGTCAKAIELFTQRQDVVEALEQVGFCVSSIVANSLELSNGRFTGRIKGRIITKHSKIESLPKGSIFIGDNRDQKIVIRMKDREFEFINCQKIDVWDERLYSDS
jgi:hypothetical protein